MKITLDFEEQAFASLRRGPEEFAPELRLVARICSRMGKYTSRNLQDRGAER
ncbi:MAG: hypothetical protein JJT96_19735 [Opitutales bacterium]|nr:hypothetical protein [Opitutales bacterium]